MAAHLSVFSLTALIAVSLGCAPAVRFTQPANDSVIDIGPFTDPHPLPVLVSWEVDCVEFPSDALRLQLDSGGVNLGLDWRETSLFMTADSAGARLCECLPVRWHSLRSYASRHLQ